MNVATANDQVSTWKYVVIPESAHHPDGDGMYTAYAIQVQGRGQKKTVHDVSVCEEMVVQLVNLFNQHQLSIYHLEDVIEDMLP